MAAQNTISGTFTINIIEDGVAYFLETTNASATIPADQSSVAYNGTVRAYKRDGNGDKAEYPCYVTVWKKKGTAYTRWLYTTAKQTSYTISGTASQSDCDTIVVTMSDIAITTHSAYLAEIEIPVYKAGDTGNGIASVTEYYLATASSSGVTPSTSGWTTTIQTVTATKKYLWNYEVIHYSNGTSSATTPVIIGTYGDKGVGIGSITEHYLATSASSGVTRSTTGWTTSIQTVTNAKKYLWNYETVTYTDGSTADTDPVIIGVYGDTGNGIASVTEYYARNNSTTEPADSSFDTEVLNPTESQKYVWNYEVITYTNGNTTRTDKHIVATYSKDGVGISSFTEYYAVNNSATSAPADSEFSTDVVPPTATAKYLWNYEVVTYTNNTTERTSKRVIGTYGEKGDDAVVYSVTTSNGSVTIPAGEVSAEYTGSVVPRRRIGSGNATPYSCYITIWKKKGSTYTEWSHSPNKISSLGITIRDVTTASYDAIVVTMSDTILSAHAGYLAEIEIPVYKIGDNGTRGKTGRFYYYAGDWEQPDQQIHWVQTAKELEDTAINTYNGGSYARQADGSVKVTVTTANTSGIYIAPLQSGITAGHKYLFATCLQNPIPLRIRLTSSMVVCQANDTKHVITSIFTANSSLEHYGNGTAGTFTLYYIRCIDLTAIYGAGNEPATVEDFEADYKAWKGMASTATIDYSEMLKTDEMLDVFGNSYLVSDQGAPWFSYQEQNYVFVPEENGPYTRAQMGTPREAEGSAWELMWNDQNFLITKAVFAEFAKFGSAIISGDWMISTNGTIGGVDYADGAMATVVKEGVPVTQPAYMFFDTAYPDTDNGGTNFIPYRSEDLRTGSSYLMNAHVRGTVDADTFKKPIWVYRRFQYTYGDCTTTEYVMPREYYTGDDGTEFPERMFYTFFPDIITTRKEGSAPTSMASVIVIDLMSTYENTYGELIYRDCYDNQQGIMLPNPSFFDGHEVEIIMPYSTKAFGALISSYVHEESSGVEEQQLRLCDITGRTVSHVKMNYYDPFSQEDTRPTELGRSSRLRLLSVKIVPENFSRYKSMWMILETENAEVAVSV